MPALPALGRWKQENQEFKTNLSYRVSLRLGWAIGHPTTTKEKSEKEKVK